MGETTDLAAKILSGDRLALSRAITLVESVQADHKRQAFELVESLGIREATASFRIAISGSPGVGKSTLIEHLGLMLSEQGKKVAVLAIDPSSRSSHGSILGDKTRMEKLSKHPNAYIRPSPSAGLYGGISAATYETAHLCAAAGYQFIFIETVGAGQSEVEAKQLADLFILLLQPGAGDELQGIKRGIMEASDMVVITKCDGDLEKPHQLLKRQLEPLMGHHGSKLPMVSFSSKRPESVHQLWKAIRDASNEFERKSLRQEQNLYWFRKRLAAQGTALLLNHYQETIEELENEISSQKMHYLRAIALMIRRLEKDLHVK